MAIRVCLASILLFAGVAPAGEPQLLVQENQAVVQVHGVVCSFCAYGAEKSLSELDCLDIAEFGNGVLIDIDTHRITLAIRPGEKIPIRDIYHRIKNAGYDPITFYLRTRGTLEKSGEDLILRDIRSGQVFRIGGGDIAGLEIGSPVTLQTRLLASQVLSAAEGDPIEVTVDRVISPLDRPGDG